MIFVIIVTMLRWVRSVFFNIWKVNDIGLLSHIKRFLARPVHDISKYLHFVGLVIKFNLVLKQGQICPLLKLYTHTILHLVICFQDSPLPTQILGYGQSIYVLLVEDTIFYFIEVELLLNVLLLKLLALLCTHAIQRHD